MKELKRPIIILGAARSGTTLMVRILKEHPEVACWNEPSFVWRYGHAFRENDVRRKEDATPDVINYIRAQFQAFLEQSSGSRFMEKTPANCFRVPFVLEVFPDAQIIHIIRDGRDVAISAADMWSGGAIKPVVAQRKTAVVAGRSGSEVAPPEVKAGWRRMAWIWEVFKAKTRFSERHVSDWGSFMTFLEKATLTLDHFRRHMFYDSKIPWGPQFPGFSRVRRAYSLLQTCAVQWDLSVRMARSACLGLPEDRYLEVRYEALLANPEAQVERVLSFLGLPFDDALVARLASDVGRKEVSTWPTMLSEAEVRDIEEVVAATLADLGYPLMAVAHRQDRPVLVAAEV